MIMRLRSLLSRIPRRSLASDRRGIAAAEFALIAPALIFMVMGVFEMSFRFRASEEASRYVHQVADLISRETSLTTSQLEDIYGASTNLMKPLDTNDNLDVDVSSIAFIGNTADPQIFWRRVAGTPVTYDLTEAEGMGIENETVIRVGIRYRYQSILSNLFGGGTATMIRSAYARPRVERIITLDGAESDDGQVHYISAS